MNVRLLCNMKFFFYAPITIVILLIVVSNFSGTDIKYTLNASDLRPTFKVEGNAITNNTVYFDIPMPRQSEQVRIVMEVDSGQQPIIEIGAQTSNRNFTTRYLYSKYFEDNVRKNIFPSISLPSNESIMYFKPTDGGMPNFILNNSQVIVTEYSLRPNLRNVSLIYAEYYPVEFVNDSEFVGKVYFSSENLANTDGHATFVINMPYLNRGAKSVVIPYQINVTVTRQSLWSKIFTS